MSAHTPKTFMIIDPLLHRITAAQPYPLLFATISGAHLYGFPSQDSDFDLRGVHVLPLHAVLGLNLKHETLEDSRVIEGLEMDIVSHDVRKFIGLLLKKNGYVLEQLFSPLIVQTTPEHEEMKELAKHCITRNHAHHYLGFAESQWRLLEREDPPRLKPLLYLYRVLLTGIWLMRTGEVEANLPRLNQSFQLSQIEDLILRKTQGQEQEVLTTSDLSFHQSEFQRLLALLEEAQALSSLREAPAPETQQALSDLLIRTRLKKNSAD
jgi:uncharacterized protein